MTDLSSQATAKPWYTSRTIWAGIIGAGAGVVGISTNHALAPADVQALGSDVATLCGAVASVVSAVSGAVAIYGRWKASHPIAKS